MDKFLTFTIVGLSVAAIYAVIASGLVLTYTTTGIFNFAHGAAGMLAAFTYWQLRFDWGWPDAGRARRDPRSSWRRCSASSSRSSSCAGSQDTTETVKLVVSISLLLFMIGLAQLIWAPGVSRPDGELLRVEPADRPRPDDDHVAPGDHDRGRDRRRDRPAPRARPDSASASRCVPRSTTARSPR